MKRILFIIIASCLSFAVYAADQKLEDKNVDVLMREGMEESEIDAAWAIRVTNATVLGRHRAAMEAHHWCKYQDKDKPCQAAFQMLSDTENSVIEAIKVTSATILHLASLQKSKENDRQIIALQAQLSALKAAPFPLHDALNQKKESDTK